MIDWTPPDVGATDQERRGYLLRVLVPVTAVTVLLAVIVTALSPNQPAALAGAIAAFSVPLAITWALLDRGKVRAAGWFFSISTWIALTFSAWNFGGASGSAAPVYVTVVLLAGATAGRSALVVAAAMSVTAIASMGMLELADRLPPPVTPMDEGQWMLAGTINVSVAATVLFLAMSLADRAREASTTATQSAEELRRDLDSRTKLTMQQRDEIAVHELIRLDLLDARDETEAALAARSRLVANVSHELRTPMNGVVGLADLLIDGELPPHVRPHVITIRECSVALLSLIDDILDLAKVESGHLDVEDVDFTVEDILSLVTSPASIEAERRGVEFHVNGLETLPRRAAGDPARIRQILTNLLANALKFTEAGRAVTLEAACSDRDDGGHWVTFTVRDEGIGMDAETVNRVFDPFVQANASVSRRFGGTGLGLAITSQLVGRLGGTIGVQSEPGVGSTFVVELPLGEALSHASRAPELDWSAEDRGRFDGARVLVVDDNAVNRQVAMAMLSNLGLESDSAMDGDDALSCLARRPYDLVLMDCQMPVRDGFSATRELRASDGLNRDVTVIALTAQGGDEAGEQCRAAGMDDIVVKPVRLKTLARLAEAILVPGAGDQSSPRR